MADEFSGFQAGFTTIVSSTATASLIFGGVPSVVNYLQQYTPIKPPDDHPIYSFVGRIASDWASKDHQAKSTWQHVENQLNAAAIGAVDAVGVAVPLRLVLLLERVPCLPN
jgi:hypothetical protein